MRDYLARAIVRWVSSYIERSFTCHCNCHYGYAGLWAKAGKLAGKVGLPFARLIDRDAAVEQMAQEGWWG